MVARASARATKAGRASSATRGASSSAAEKGSAFGPRRPVAGKQSAQNQSALAPQQPPPPPAAPAEWQQQPPAGYRLPTVRESVTSYFVLGVGLAIGMTLVGVLSRVVFGEAKYPVGSVGSVGSANDGGQQQPSDPARTRREEEPGADAVGR